MPEHETVTGTVHGFHTPLLALNIEGEHAVFVMLSVT